MTKDNWSPNQEQRAYMATVAAEIYDDRLMTLIEGWFRRGRSVEEVRLIFYSLAHMGKNENDL